MGITNDFGASQLISSKPSRLTHTGRYTTRTQLTPGKRTLPPAPPWPPLPQLRLRSNTRHLAQQARAPLLPKGLLQRLSLRSLSKRLHLRRHRYPLLLADRPWTSRVHSRPPFVACAAGLSPLLAHIGSTDEEVPSRIKVSSSRLNCSLFRSPTLHVSTYGRCTWVVHVVRSGGLSTDSALPLVGRLRA